MIQHGKRPDPILERKLRIKVSAVLSNVSEKAAMTFAGDSVWIEAKFGDEGWGFTRPVTRTRKGCKNTANLNKGDHVPDKVGESITKERSWGSNVKKGEKGCGGLHW